MIEFTVGSDKLYIPKSNELEPNHINKNISLLVTQTKIDDTFIDDADSIVLTKNDELYHRFIKNGAKIHPINCCAYKTVKIGNSIYTYCSFIGPNLIPERWTYIGEFSIKENLLVSDPCYIKDKYTDVSYNSKIKDDFIVFCHMGDKQCYVITDVLIINKKMYLENQDIEFILNDSMFSPVYDIPVDSGTICFCEDSNIRKLSKSEYKIWYNDELTHMCYEKAYTLSLGGIILQSGYGDGIYTLKKYKDSNKCYLAYYISFINQQFEEEE